MRPFAFAACLLPLGALAPAAIATAAELVASQQAEFRVVEVTRGLSDARSLALLPPESGGGILVAERRGNLRLFRDGRLGSPIEGVPEVSAVGEGGLLDVVLHPDFADNSWIYLGYASRDRGGYGVRVARARFDGQRLDALQIVFDMAERSRKVSNFGARLAFDGEGSLFLALGDRDDPERAQDPGDTAGSILRLTDTGATPPDNPFVGRQGHDARIYAYGVRDPQGLARHPESGAIWEQERGPRGGDEINRVEPGANFGWPQATYGLDYAGTAATARGSSAGITDPLYYWNTSIAPSGLAFYDGTAFPDWQGDLFMGASDARLLVRLELEGERVVGEERLLQGQVGRIRDVRVGPDGLVHLLTSGGDGALYRLEPAD